ncbi:MAG: DUF6851 domain-containing protein [Ekhidna sp.]
MNKTFLLLISCTCILFNLKGQETHARIWNEALLESIRNDEARPTVHARNLFHVSAAMYDIWAIYEGNSQTYFIGKTVDGYRSFFEGFSTSEDTKSARNESISYAVYRIIKHRFVNSVRRDQIFKNVEDLMEELGYDINYTSYDYQNTKSPAALGNYVARCIIQYGLRDGSNEENDYASQLYQPVNVYDTVYDPNHWQPIRFGVFVSQSGVRSMGVEPAFITPEWGKVHPFSLSKNDLSILKKEEDEYWVYHDPGPPPLLDSLSPSDDYKNGFALVASWTRHLDTTDGVLWDISPKSIGNLESLPESIDEYSDFYDFEEGGDNSRGWELNPITNTPYKEQIVPRSDYVRILAEFWADGPDSETPPGHWFTILNYVSDHPDFEKRFSGEGDILDDFEWEVKSYFTLGGAMHDAAISAWGIKGYYDYVRPRTAIRYMSSNGQSSDPNLPFYSNEGIPLIDDLFKIGQFGILTKGWRGDQISDPNEDIGGVDWMIANRWIPFQRLDFVTPPFAGYISGHSTFSRAAAVVMTQITGSEFFPNGLGEFYAPKNEFLVAENGPSIDVTLQWATYQDAADQCSLSRIWGGIHPPVDDIPGRKIGSKIGQSAFTLAQKYFNNEVIEVDYSEEFIVFPNPAKNYVYLNIPTKENYVIRVIDSTGKIVFSEPKSSPECILDFKDFQKGIYYIELQSPSTNKSWRIIKK